MFRTILVCLDGSLLAEQILPYAADEAVAHEGQVILFRVTTVPIIPSPAIPGAPSAPLTVATMEQAAIEDEAEAGNYLERVAATLLDERGLRARCVVVPGDAGEAIVSYARSEDVDLIAIATHGRSGLGKAVFGSVADYVLRRSGHPVLLIKPS
jgi:nucleotide-binding universal stress UspA family protein